MSIFGTPVTFHNSVAFGPTSVSVTVPTSAGDLLIVGTITSNGSGQSVQDTLVNSWAQAGVQVSCPTNNQNINYFYCLSSNGTNAANSVKFNFGAAARGSLYVWRVPITGGTVVFDVTKSLRGNVSSGTQTTTTFNTAGTDEFIAGIIGCDNPAAAVFTAGSGYTLDAGTGIGEGQFDQLAAQHITYSSPQTGITSSFGASQNSTSFAYILAGFMSLVFSISGNAGTAGATVSYTGTSSGSVTADGSGNYTIPGLQNGSYTVTPSKTGFIFSPTNRALTISGSNLTGQNFTATAVFSISGNAGTCGATVSYSGTASGSVTANGSGDYTISNLVAGSYTITPTKLGFTFSPASSPQTITSSNITGLNFFTVLDGGVILTPVYVNTLTGANQNPLDPTNLSNATFGNMQVLSNVGLGTQAANDNEAYYIGSPALGNDQYASITIHAWVSGFDNSLFLEVRSPDGQDGYVVNVFDNNDGTASIELDVVVGGFVTDTLYFDSAAVLPVTCDMFTLMAVGTTVGLFKNSTQLVVATNTKFSSGSALVAVTTNSNPLTNLTVTNFVMGNASGLLPPPVVASLADFRFGFDFNF